MSRGLNLNNTENIIADNISIVQGNNVVDIFDLFAEKGSSSGGVDLSNYYNKSEIDTSLGLKLNASEITSYYTITQTDARIQLETNARNLLATNTATALAGKQVQLTAGANIQISNVGAISATGPLEVAVDGALQSGVTRLDFLAPISNLSSGVLSIGPSDFQSRLSLIYASSADALDLTRNQSGKLLWDGAEVASKASVDDERTARQQFQSDTNTVLNTKQTIDAAQTKVRLGTSSTSKDLTKSATGTLVWGSNDIVEAPTLNALETYTIAQLATKQDELAASDGITIDNLNIIKSAVTVLNNGSSVQSSNRLDFRQFVVSPTIDNKVLIDPPSSYFHIDFAYGTSSNVKRLERTQTDKLKWGNNDLVEAPTLDATEAYLLSQIGGKQDTLVAGSGITISGTTISASGGSGSLTLSVDGQTQAGATQLDINGYDTYLNGTTLLLGPPNATRVGLWYASRADHKDLWQGAGGVLKWGTETVQMEAIRPHAQFARAGGQSFGAGFTPIAWDQVPISSGISLNTTTYSFTVSRAGTYHFDVGMRNGSGPDEWHGVSILSSTTGGVVAKSYATGQDTPVSGEGHSWHLLASLSTDTAYNISLYRQTGMTVSSPGQPVAGYAIVATITYVS